MNLSQWFQTQLHSSAEGFAWSVEQVPPERRYVPPPRPLGEWSAARHAFHLLYYEQTIALPSMRQWLGGPMSFLRGPDEDAAWGRGQAVESLLAQFREIRAEQIAILPQCDDALWEETRRAVWGPVTLRWVVTKTYQHTAEHT
ncbi:MAG: hypothetical protein HW418_1058, partial [Anaerolineales bacterium]|nr:hypothetical protein [Anaerolineales bacterium]